MKLNKNLTSHNFLDWRRCCRL